jgi:hypothetical protein
MEIQFLRGPVYIIDFQHVALSRIFRALDKHCGACLMTQKLLASNTQLAHMMLDIGVCCPVFQLYGLKNSIFKIIADKFHLIAGTFLSLVMQHASFLLVKSTRGGIFNKEPGAFRLILELVICDISFVVQVVLVENFICSIHVGFVNIEIFIDFLTISSLEIIC